MEHGILISRTYCVNGQWSAICVLIFSCWPPFSFKHHTIISIIPALDCCYCTEMVNNNNNCCFLTRNHQPQCVIGILSARLLLWRVRCDIVHVVSCLRNAHWGHFYQFAHIVVKCYFTTNDNGNRDNNILICIYLYWKLMK